MIETEDHRVVQLVCSGLLACGLLITVASSFLFRIGSDGTSVGEITAQNSLSWSPRGFLGSGPPGRSPVFGVMWSLIYAGQLYLSIALLVTALQDQVVHDVFSAFTACACCFSATLVAAFWTPVFTMNTRYGFVLSTFMLFTCATLSTIGAVAAKPFLSPTVDQPWIDTGFVLLGFFAGWTVVATGLSTGITVRVYDRGIASKSEEADDAVSFFPLALSILLAVVSIVFACPVLPFPLFVALFFVRNLFRRWTLFVPLIVSAVGIGVGIAIVIVYRESGGVFW